jgi:hypothetical protein
MLIKIRYFIQLQYNWHAFECIYRTDRYFLSFYNIRYTSLGGLAIGTVDWQETWYTYLTVFIAGDYCVYSSQLKIRV